MAASLVITLREGLEASLIVAIILAYLVRVGARDRARVVWWGVAAAVAASAGLGAVVLATVGTLEGRAEELFEGAAMLLAAGVLTYVVVWMRRQSRTARMALQSQVAAALMSGSDTALFTLSFVAVVREGLETALFLFAATRTSSGLETLVGGLLGLGAAAALGYGVYAGSRRLDLRLFFEVSGIVLILFAAGLLAHGVHELEEAAVLPVLVAHVWDINWLLDETSVVGSFLKALFGYNGNPSLLEAASYFGYLAASLVYYLSADTPARALPAEVSRPIDRGPVV